MRVKSHKKIHMLLMVLLSALLITTMFFTLKSATFAVQAAEINLSTQTANNQSRTTSLLSR